MIHDFGYLGGSVGGTGAQKIIVDTDKDILLFQDKTTKYYFHKQWSRQANEWWYSVESGQFTLLNLKLMFDILDSHIPTDKRAYAVWAKYNPNI